MTRLLAFLKRRPDLSRAQFMDYYENHHVPLIRSIAPEILEYRRNYLVEPVLRLGSKSAEPDFDVVTELTFADDRRYRAAMRALAAESTKIRADEANFLDTESLILLGVESRS